VPDHEIALASATLRRPPPLPGILQGALLALLFLLAAASWALTDDRMGGMDAAPGSDLGDLGWFMVTWLTMMAAMMFPSLAPMVVMHARIQRGRRERSGVASTVVFVTGYLAAWCAFGLLGYMVVEGVRSLDVGFLAWDEAGRYVAGGVIVAASLYELTALKDACLRHCRNPQTLDEHWRPGPIGSLRMGVEHGGFCLGCCWALMAALFAVGVMSVGWMALVAALIAIEKLAPWRAVASRAVAVLLAVLGLAVAFVPEDVPGLTIPGAPGESQMMMEQ
jgi:predicted metal-binding membrane protein